MTAKQYKEDMLFMINIMIGLNKALKLADPDNPYCPNIEKVLEKKKKELGELPD